MADTDLIRRLKVNIEWRCTEPWI